MRFDALLHDAVAALQPLIGQKKHGEFSLAVSGGNDGNDGCGGNLKNRNTTYASAASWFEEAEASDGNSARDAQGGELERAKGATWHLRRSAYRLAARLEGRWARLSPSSTLVSCTEAPASAGQMCSVASAWPPAAP